MVQEKLRWMGWIVRGIRICNRDELRNPEESVDVHVELCCRRSLGGANELSFIDMSRVRRGVSQSKSPEVEEKGEEHERKR